MAQVKPPWRPGYLASTYLFPSTIIFSGLFQTSVKMATIFIAAVMTFPIYKAFSLVGKRFNLSYSYLMELIYLRKIHLVRPVHYKAAFGIFRRMLMLHSFELTLVLFTISGPHGYAIFPGADALSGLLILFYIVIDFFFACYRWILKKIYLMGNKADLTDWDLKLSAALLAGAPYGGAHPRTCCER